MLVVVSLEQLFNQVVKIVVVAEHHMPAVVPDEPMLVRKARGQSADVIVAFFRARSQLERRLPALRRALSVDGALWIAWPRRAAGHESDITDSDLRALILPSGLHCTCSSCWPPSPSATVVWFTGARWGETHEWGSPE